MSDVHVRGPSKRIIPIPDNPSVISHSKSVPSVIPSSPISLKVWILLFILVLASAMAGYFLAAKNVFTYHVDHVEEEVQERKQELKNVGGNGDGNGLVVETKEGKVEGYVDQTTLTKIWAGVPYAAPPVGNNRFRSPQKLMSWKGVLPTIKNAEVCVQIESVNGNQVVLTGSEDCLHVNIYAPPNSTPESNLPVMFFIFGGGFIRGDLYLNGLYDGRKLALKHNVIVVTVNYRLGVLGFYSHSALQNEDPEKSTGNYGLQDQRAAMKWTKENIAPFGGNPEKITIFGESAGAVSVCAHLVSPNSKGLFSGAIIESGNCDNAVSFRPVEKSITFGDAAALAMNCNDKSTIVNCLRSASLEKLFTYDNFIDAKKLVYTPRLFPAADFGPTIDGSSNGIPDLPISLIRQGKYHKVPLIVGSNLDEGRLTLRDVRVAKNINEAPISENTFSYLLNWFFSAETSKIVAKEYPLEEFPNQDERFSRIFGDYAFTCSVRRIARATTSPTWLYHFVHLSSWSGGYVNHGDELYFVFNNPDSSHPFTTTDDYVSAMIGLYWTNMAKHKDPNGVGNSKLLLKWPHYSVESDKNIKINSTMSVESGLQAKRCDFWDNIVSNPSNIIP